MSTTLPTIPAADHARHPTGSAGRRALAAATGLGLAAGAAIGVAPSPAGAETYYTGSCIHTHRGGDGVVRYRTFQARINGAIEQGTGKYVWVSYDYRYIVDPGLSFGPHSNEKVEVTEGYVSGLSNPWWSPDSHGTSGSWIAEANWKGIKSWWGWTRVKFTAWFDIPSVSDPSCSTTTARV